VTAWFATAPAVFKWPTWPTFPGTVFRIENCLVIRSRGSPPIWRLRSKANTEAEMERKRGEYFERGASLVWVVDHKQRNVRVYTDVQTHLMLGDADRIDGGSVLPGFDVQVKEFFADLSE
jgi:hypothetical protein